MSYKYNLTGKIVGKLTIKEQVPKELRPTTNHGNYWYCDCACGTKNIMVPTSYLSGNGNYTQTSCGCDRKIKAFQSSSRQDLDENFLNSFDNFEKYLTLHKMFVRTTNIDILHIPLEEYKKIIIHFYYDKQFNAVYDFWINNNHNNYQTFYDLAKPSLDHIIPKSKGGTDNLNNLQILTVFENLAKRDMNQEEWDIFKK